MLHDVAFRIDIVLKIPPLVAERADRAFVAALVELGYRQCLLMLRGAWVVLQFDLPLELRAAVIADVLPVDGEPVFSGTQPMDFERFSPQLMSQLRELRAKLCVVR